MTTFSQVDGKVAHDATDSGNPMKMGAYAAASAVEVGVVAHGDRVNLIADAVGKLIILPYANPELFGTGFASATATATEATVLASAGGGVRWYVTSVSVWNKSATNTGAIIKDGSTAKWYLAAPARSGSNHQFVPPLRMTANTDVKFSVETAVGSTTPVWCSLDGYKGA